MAGKAGGVGGGSGRALRVWTVCRPSKPPGAAQPSQHHSPRLKAAVVAQRMCRGRLARTVGLSQRALRLGAQPQDSVLGIREPSGGYSVRQRPPPLPPHIPSPTHPVPHISLPLRFGGVGCAVAPCGLWPGRAPADARRSLFPRQRGGCRVRSAHRVPAAWAWRGIRRAVPGPAVARLHPERPQPRLRARAERQDCRDEPGGRGALLKRRDHAAGSAGAACPSSHPSPPGISVASLGSPCAGAATRPPP